MQDQHHNQVPDEQAAAVMLDHALGWRVHTIRRFPMGLAHWVYDVVTEDGRRVVVRLAPAGGGEHFRAAPGWHTLLRPLDVPLPELYFFDDGAALPFPTLIMERLPGVDLGAVYGTLTAAQKAGVAERIVDIQQRVGTLPLGPGYGFARSYADTTLHRRWSDVVVASLARSRAALEAVGVIAPHYVDRLLGKVDHYAAYFARIEPRAFLDDLTTKNVLVADGQLTGIVDVDTVCFGDGLFTPALTQMALLADGRDIAYVSYWLALVQATGEQRQVVRFYTAVFCVDFMSELGQAHNKDSVAPIDHAYVARLHTIFERLYAGL